MVSGAGVIKPERGCRAKQAKVEIMDMKEKKVNSAKICFAILVKFLEECTALIKHAPGGAVAGQDIIFGRLPDTLLALPPRLVGYLRLVS